MNDAADLVRVVRSHQLSVTEVGRAIVAMLRVGLMPYVMFSHNGDIDLAAMEPRRGSDDAITMRFERLRSLTPTEARTAIEHGAGQFHSHKPPPPSAHDLPDPTG